MMAVTVMPFGQHRGQRASSAAAWRAGYDWRRLRDLFDLLQAELDSDDVDEAQRVVRRFQVQLALEEGDYGRAALLVAQLRRDDEEAAA